MLCSFCSKSEPVRINISSMNLRICPGCLATFLPASQFAALRRETSNATKGAWIRACRDRACPVSTGTPVCLEHGVPLVPGTIPDFSFEGLVPTCCDLQHLPPPLMIKILELGIGASGGSMGGLFGVPKRKLNPVAELLGGIVFRFWEKRQKKVDDGLDRLQYNFKFKDVLGEWIE